MAPASLRCQNLTKRYPGQEAYALGGPEDGVSFDVHKGELFALLGPSGCGKTTTLRIVGGFVPPSGGTVEIEGVDVTSRPPYARPTNTVFQSYALFPHLSLGANVAFGLKMQRVPRREQLARAAEALELVGLGGMEKRRVGELSGGQQQRAALARAIVKRPAILLLDEPLGALDLKLRKQMQDELVRLKRTTGTTFVHVTHDQEEACATADRIAVMNEGRIVQVDTPVALYRAPRTTFVAAFIDAGTIVRGSATRRGDVLEIAHPDILVRGQSANGAGPAHATAAVLPHDRVAVRAGDGAAEALAPDEIACTMDRLVFTGSVFHLYARTSQQLEIKAAVAPEDVTGQGLDRLAPGDRVVLSWAPEDVIFVHDDEPASRVEAAPAEAMP